MSEFVLLRIASDMVLFFIITFLVDFLQKQFKYLKDNLKKCLDKRSKMTKSGAAASTLPKCNYFDQMSFLCDKTVNRASDSNIILINNQNLQSPPQANRYSFTDSNTQSLQNAGFASSNEPLTPMPSPAPSLGSASTSSDICAGRGKTKRKRSDVNEVNTILNHIDTIESE